MTECRLPQPIRVKQTLADSNLTNRPVPLETSHRSGEVESWKSRVNMLLYRTSADFIDSSHPMRSSIVSISSTRSCRKSVVSSMT